MYCPNCGKMNPEDDRFCYHCGTELIDNQPDQPVIVNDAAQALDHTFNFLFKHRKGLIIGVSILIGVIVLFYTVKAIVGQFVGSDRVVEDYVEAMIDRDWDDMYDCLALPEGEMLSREAFSSYMDKNTAIGQNEIARYEIQERLNGYDQASSLIKRYDVTYVGLGSSSEKSFTVTLVQQPEKKLLFFPDYKVSTEDMICSPNAITKPGATLTIDGVTITEGVENEDGNYLMALPAMFIGTHQVEVTYPYCETIEENVYLENGQYLYYTDFYLDENTKQELIDRTKEMANVLYPAVGANTPLDAVVLPCGFTDEAYASLKNEYESMLNQFHGYTNTQTTNITVTNVQINTDTDRVSYDSDGVRFEVGVEYSYTQIYRSRTNVYDDYGYFGVTYQLVDGEWVVYYVTDFSN